MDDNYDKNDPSESFVRARKDYDDENYTMAIQSLGEFKARFPYSKFATLAELMIADSHFRLEQFEEAAVAYKQFAKLHPKHEKVEFALYRVGLCYWYASPESPDRDQGFTKLAVREWNGLLARSPDSEYSKQAKELVQEGNTRIADNLSFVADFYCKIEEWASCAYRSLTVVNEFPEMIDRKKRYLLKASDAMMRLSRMKREDPESDKNTYFNLLTADEIQREGERMKEQAQAL